MTVAGSSAEVEPNEGKIYQDEEGADKGKYVKYKDSYGMFEGSFNENAEGMVGGGAREGTRGGR